MTTRVSCSALARIEDAEGNILLHIAKKRGNNGIIMRPLGGPLLGTPNGIKQLKALGATLFEHEPRLQFLVGHERLTAIEKWFMRGSRSQRELTIQRVLIEQLCHDMHILSETDVRNLKCRSTKLTRRSGNSSNPHADISQTQYLIEVFDVTAPPRIMAKLQRATEGGRRKLSFVSPEDIQKHKGPGDYVSILADPLRRDAK